MGNLSFRLPQATSATSSTRATLKGELHKVDVHQHSTWQRLQQLEVDPWAEGARPHWRRLRVERISGRRVATGPPAEESEATP